MFEQEELVKIHNIMIQYATMAEAEGIVSKIRSYFKEQEEAKKEAEQNEKQNR